MGYEVHEMSNETHEKQHPATAVDIAFEMGVTVDRIGQVFRAFRNGGHPAFTGPFNRIAPLTPMQLAAIRGEDMPRPKEQDTSEAFLNCTDDSEPAKGLPNEAAPAGGLVVDRNYWHLAALSVAFVFPTVASGVNTFTISHQLSGQPAVSYAILGMVSLTPILFIIARMERVGVVVALGVVAFEAFCNVAATYLSLMGGMVYAFGVPRGACSPFLQNIVELTESAHKNTAIGIAIAVAIIVSSVQLTAFWGLKNRI